MRAVVQPAGSLRFFLHQLRCAARTTACHQASEVKTCLEDAVQQSGLGSQQQPMQRAPLSSSARNTMAPTLCCALECSGTALRKACDPLPQLVHSKVCSTRANIGGSLAKQTPFIWFMWPVRAFVPASKAASTPLHEARVRRLPRIGCEASHQFPD